MLLLCGSYLGFMERGCRYFVRRKPRSIAKADAKDWYSLDDLYAL